MRLDANGTSIMIVALVALIHPKPDANKLHSDIRHVSHYLPAGVPTNRYSTIHQLWLQLLIYQECPGEPEAEVSKRKSTCRSKKACLQNLIWSKIKTATASQDKK